MARYPSGFIKSIQRGTTTHGTSGAATATATINAVNTAKCEISLIGVSGDFNTSPKEYLFRVSLTDATTITTTRNSATGFSTGTVAFQVVEYF